MPESISSLDELQQLPFTTPENIRQKPLRFVCVWQDEIRRVVMLQSFGTTGAPKRIYFTVDNQELTIDFFGVGHVHADGAGGAGAVSVVRGGSLAV